ncbi:hypothetical protein [uncultured Selenomonas sp.]|uniref:hypothetical protein n=1 Tax=uncultured Selenomonas sp. TaxID=159275 RepID=UPI002805DF89|nr:hypothetical protein [uncultured Selenomonas sp.]
MPIRLKNCKEPRDMRRLHCLEALSLVLPSAAPVHVERPALVALPQGNVARSVRQPHCSHLAAVASLPTCRQPHRPLRHGPRFAH